MLIRGNLGTTGEKAVWISTASLELLFLLTTPVTHGIMYFDKDLNYQHGVLMPVLYAFACMILAYALILFMSHRDILSSFQMATNITFLSLMLVVIVFQALRPDILIESFGAAISFLMMNVALDNPATYFYKNTYCYNQTAFDSMVNRRIETKDDFPLIALAFDDLYVFRRQYGDRAYDKMIDRAIRKCHRLYGQKNVYILNGDIFAIEPKYDSSDTAIDRLSAIFGTRIKVGDEYFTFAPHFCVLSEHKKAESASDINASINDMLVDVFRKTGERVIYDASEMLKDKHREEEIVHILRDALTNDGFDVYYQPLYDPVEKKYIAAEALVRLCNQSIGYISPDEFIPKRKFQ